ncbi:hypothetical protein LQ764DRAFT_12 [Zygosaccharomyces rouxii]|nr:hypothetical protein LQ764DRAFT_220744 [Zygosaccharomyces rouxii]KAH9202081.1 hypothetical protein LQ764DRAFT_12 [Zygosaccharomyces rouxii]
MSKIDYHDSELTHVILPKDFFWCELTWELYHLTKYYEPWLILLTLILMSVITAKQICMLPMSAVVVVSSLSVALVYFTVIWLSYKRYAAACKEKVNLAQVVLTVNPNVEEKKWDKVAYKMNLLPKP